MGCCVFSSSQAELNIPFPMKSSNQSWRFRIMWIMFESADRVAPAKNKFSIPFIHQPRIGGIRSNSLAKRATSSLWTFLQYDANAMQTFSLNSDTRQVSTTSFASMKRNQLINHEAQIRISRWTWFSLVSTNLDRTKILLSSMLFRLCPRLTRALLSQHHGKVEW